jgi:hypothetical protein
VEPFRYKDAASHQTRPDAPESSQPDTPMGDSQQTIRGLRNAVFRFDTVSTVSTENKEMLKSWVKVFLAAAVSMYMAGNTSPHDLLNAGLIAVLPLVYSWLDPKDHRFGRGAE